MQISKLDIEQRVNLSLLAGRYVRAVEQEDRATKQRREAEQDLIDAIRSEAEFVAKVDHQHYLFAMSNPGVITCEKIELI
jgi:hypothetical protein